MQSTDPKPKSKLNQKALIIAALILVLAVGFGIRSFATKQAAEPFPTDIASSLNYPVYYLSGAVNGYSYKAGSAKIQAGILFYTMTKGVRSIYITEQAAPSAGINLKSLPKHTPLDVPIGKAVIGTGLGNPSVVIITPSTLIQITSSKGVAKDDITAVAKKISLQNNTQTQY